MPPLNNVKVTSLWKHGAKKTMKNNILIHIFLLAIILVTSSCTLQQTAKDPLTILEMKTCEPPCWQGITPGITTLDEANSLIRQISIYPENPDIFAPVGIFSHKDGGVSFDFSEPQIRVEISVNDQGIVDYIKFIFTDRNRPRLGECTNLYGEPQFIGLSIIRGLEFTESRFQVAYPNIALGFFRDMLFRPKSVKIPYSSFTHIKSITYFSRLIEPTNYDYIFPWKENGVLEYEWEF
jgi:hypothetical protein